MSVMAQSHDSHITKLILVIPQIAIRLFPIRALASALHHILNYVTILT
jgi:hypothetical protein